MNIKRIIKNDRLTDFLYVFEVSLSRAVLCKNTQVRATPFGFLHDRSSDAYVMYAEACFALYWQLRDATSTRTVIAALTTFYHTLSGSSVTGSAARLIHSFAHELHCEFTWHQSGNTWLDVMDGLYSDTRRVVKSALGDKITKVINHVVAHAIYKKLDVPVDLRLFSEVEKKVMRPTVWDVASFADAIVNLVLFVCKAGRQALATGDINCFFVDDSVVSDWYMNACRLRKDYEFTNNPSSVGMALPQYIEDVKSAITTGKAMLPVFRKGREANVLTNTLLELELVLKRVTVTLNASAFRRAPVGVFLYGDAGVAKSHIALGLFNHYCSVRGIDKDSATLWTRTENDDYYSGYKSHFAGVLYDDAAKYRANVVQGVDPSIGDIISAINNIQFVTPQADLPDKGKVPFRSEWVGVTSNLSELNANLYFNSSAAFLRRFAVRIQPVVKEQFRLKDQDRIDPSKIPPGEQYPDLWRFIVCVPKVSGLTGEFVQVAMFEHYSELIDYMTGVYEKHISHQTSLMETVGKLGPEALCECRLPVSICQCAKPDSVVLNVQDTTVTQSGCLCTRKHWDRVSELNMLRDVLYRTYDDKVVRAFIRETLDSPEYVKWFDPDYCNESLNDEEVVRTIGADLDAIVEEFLSLSPRQRLEELSETSFNEHLEENSMNYLTFVPRRGQPGFFVETQFEKLRKCVLSYCGSLTALETAALEVFIRDEVPKCIVEGWPISDIIRAAHDYLNAVTPLDDPERIRVRTDMLGETQFSFSQRLGLWFAKCYFEHMWFHSLINHLSGYSLIRSAAAKLIEHNATPAVLLASAGARVNAARGGADPLLRAFVAGALAIGVVATMYALFNSYTKAYGAPEEVHRVVSETTSDDVVHEEEDPCGDFAQMDLDAVGRLPVPRGEEKVNVWTVKERAITRLDVDPKRPHNEDQLSSAIKNNVAFCRVYGEHAKGKGHANTRALFVDSETLVLNNHALPVNAKIEVWVGPVTEEGARPSYVIDVCEEIVRRIPERDVAIITTWSLPCRYKDIKHVFTKRSFQSVGPACYFIKNRDASVSRLQVYGVHLSELRGLDGATNVSCEAWRSEPDRPTVFGECGAPLVINSTLGSVVVGIHSGYNATTNTCWAVRLFRDDFDDVRRPEVSDIVPSGVVAQVGLTKLKEGDKLYTDYHQSGHIMTHGQLKGFVARPKFTGQYTPHAFYVFAHGAEFDPPILDNMAAPKNGGWKQPQMVLKNYLHPTHSMDELVVRSVVAAICKRVKTGLTEEDLADIHPVPISVAVNGMPGVSNIDAQKHTTSAGHGKRGPKLQYLSEPEKVGIWDSYRQFDAATLSEIDAMRERAMKGLRPHAIYDACWKNEMLSRAKVEAGKARCIYMCPLAFLVNMRMSTLGICRVMIRRRDLFCMAVGLNTHSEEWDDVYRLSNKIPGENWVAGDYQAFESVLSLLISNGVSKVIEFIAVLSGNFTEDELMALRVWLADLCNATINFFGELITLLGGEASGQQLTTFFNCLANVLLHCYAYVVIHATERSVDHFVELALEFFEKVFCITLGDDVALKVHPDRPNYNHTSIQKVFADIGITYTMAQKDAPSVPYIPLEEVTFLKRSWVNHVEFPGMKLAALDKRSIYKMLCYTVPSHSVSNDEQMAAAIASAQAEAFFHGPHFFSQIADLIDEMPKSRELELRMLSCPAPTWNTMVQRFIRASPKLQVRSTMNLAPENVGTERSYCHASELELQMQWSVDAWGSTVMGRSPDHRIYGGTRPCANSVPRGVRNVTNHDLEAAGYSKNINKTTHLPTIADREMAPKVVAQAINKIRNQQRKKKRREKWDAVAQADVQYDTLSVPSPTAPATTDVVQQQVVFKNEPVSETIVAPSTKDEIADSMQMEQDVGNYLTRPQLIFSYAWVENTANGAKTDFSPWQLFFQNINMQNKLAGFHLLRCKLKLKFLINGSPFYYGSLMATYTPLNGYRLDTAEASGVEMRLTATSQKPHVWLENQNCSTVEMELPFLYPYPYMDVGRLSDFTNMGTVHLVQYAPLLSANGSSSTNVDIQIYAWAEDVQLSGPTNMPVMQSEFKPNGQISGPASTVAAVAGKLDKVPYIGPYAKATSMVASTLGDIASFFGFTNVPNVRDVEPMKQVPFSLASTSISEPVQKLSLQPKQETAIGSSQHGGDGNDELVISRFCSRSAYICGPTWNTTDGPNTILFTTAVGPQMFTRSATEVAHSPMSFVANHFQYWRGSIKYTFKVVRSPYHRGRLQISWDAGSTSLASNPQLGNANNLSTVMDLDEDSECSFIVPYMQKELFTKTYTIDNTGTALWTTSTAPTGTWTRSNGVLSVRVLNRLTAPEASSSATILVFASACDDIEFAGPRDFDVYSGSNILSLNAQTVATAQSDIQYTDEAHAAELMPRGANHRVYDQVFGERIGSLREYMHRSSLSFLWYPGATTTDVGSGAVRIPIKRIPPPPGVFANGWWTGTTTSGAGQSAFYTKMHPILSFSTCFIGYKGSVNVNVNVDQPNITTAVDTLSVLRICNGDALTAAERRPSLYVYSNPSVTIALNAKNDIIATDAGRSGCALTNTKTNAGLSVQLPYYSNSGFQMCDPRREYSNQDDFTDRNNDWWRIEWRYNKNNQTSSTSGALTSVYYATGPDFDLVYFINVPVMTLVSVVAV